MRRPVNQVANSNGLPVEDLASGQADIELSVVVPCYRCHTYLRELHSRLQQSLVSAGVSYELILVEDGSPTEDWRVIGELCSQYKQVVGIELSRNFGQHYAIACGLAHSRGRWITVMDGDLQDQPEDILPMLELARQGFDSVLTQRTVRKDNLYRRMMSSLFYALLTFLTDTPQDASISNFGVYHRKVIDAIVGMPERLRCFPIMVRWVGFRITTHPVRHANRVGSPSSYNFRKMLALATDIMVAFSDKPLRLVVQFGFLLSLASGFAGCWVIYKVLTGQVGVAGWASLEVTISFLGGLTIFVLGVVGIYIGKVFDEAKARPVYLIRQRLNPRSRNEVLNGLDDAPQGLVAHVGEER